MKITIKDLKKNFSKKNKVPVFASEMESNWTTLYFGERGSGKTLHQAKVVMKTLKWLKYIYERNPNLKRHAIIYSIQKFTPKLETEYPDYLYYWETADDLRYCPRINCWRGTKKHRLHGCYLIIDDISTILPADNWSNTPIWLRKTFFQARHFGIRILANCQDPFAVDINFRRCVDTTYRFRKIFSSKDPDETKPDIKRIYGAYIRTKIDGRQLLDVERKPFSMFGRLSICWIGRQACSIYDTTQDVPTYEPRGYEHYKYFCLKDGCNYERTKHELV